MADPPLEPGTAKRPGTPRWVIGVGIAVVAGLLLALLVMLVSGGQHGPGMHLACHEPGHYEAGMRAHVSID